MQITVKLPCIGWREKKPVQIARMKKQIRNISVTSFNGELRSDATLWEKNRRRRKNFWTYLGFHRRTRATRCIAFYISLLMWSAINKLRLSVDRWQHLVESRVWNRLEQSSKSQNPLFLRVTWPYTKEKSGYVLGKFPAGIPLPRIVHLLQSMPVLSIAPDSRCWRYGAGIARITRARTHGTRQ